MPLPRISCTRSFWINQQFGCTTFLVDSLPAFLLVVVRSTQSDRDHDILATLQVNYWGLNTLVNPLQRLYLWTHLICVRLWPTTWKVENIAMNSSPLIVLASAYMFKRPGLQTRGSLILRPRFITLFQVRRPLLLRANTGKLEPVLSSM